MSARYIVIFKEDVPREAVKEHAREIESNGGRVIQNYEELLNGFTAEIPDGHMGALQSRLGDIIDYIEPDGVAGAEDVVEELLCTGKVDANSADRFGQTPLLAAARSGHLGIVKRLLAIEDVDPEGRAESGSSPLLAAAANGHPAIVKLLLAIPTVDPDQQPSFGDRALLMAVAAGHTEVVEALLANEKVDLRLPNKYGLTALGRAAQLGRTHIMRLLLANGVDPDEKAWEGSTPIMIAAERGHVEAVELLLSTGRVQADFDLTKRNMSSTFASSELNEDVVRVLNDYKSRRGGSLLDA